MISCKLLSAHKVSFSSEQMPRESSKLFSRVRFYQQLKPVSAKLDHECGSGNLGLLRTVRYGI